MLVKDRIYIRYNKEISTVQRATWKEMREEWNNERFEAPKELVEPTKLVVIAAMARVGEEKVDNLGIQRVALEDTHRLYIVTNVGVRQTPDGVELIGNLGSGLFVNVINLDEDGSPISWGRIQIPRTPHEVNPRRIYSLRFIQPETMATLATELTQAKKVSVSLLLE